MKLTRSLLLIASGFLLCITPTATLAQQQHNADTLTAQADAKRNAKDDIIKISWLAVGACAPIASVTAGCIIGYAVADQSRSSMDYYSFGNINYTGFFAGAGATLGLTYLFVYTYKSTPPAERLLGKSPEYIEIYTTTYKKTMRSQRLIHTLAGTGGLALLLTLP